MKPQNDQFLKRKKTEKRAQAQRQVELAYQQCQGGFTDEDGNPLKGFIHDGKFHEWRIRMEPEMEEIYSTLDIVKALNIPRERLRDWMIRGFIKPSLPSTRQGTIAIFTKSDVFGVALFKKLIERGFKREVASEYVAGVVNTRIEDSLNFIVLKSLIRDGEPVIASYLHIGKASLNMEISEKGVVRSIFGRFKAEDWDDIHILNIGNLRNEVEAALATIG